MKIFYVSTMDGLTMRSYHQNPTGIISKLHHALTLNQFQLKLRQRPPSLLKYWLFLNLVVSSALTSAADNDNLDISAESISEFSLEELLDINVSVASTKTEIIPETPAIVSVYRADDLKNFGLHTLKDMLSFIPGVTVTNSFGTNVVSIRGIVEAFNQKVLLLLNNVPYFMPSHSNIPLLGIPIESIARVEVIRGPGAVYHGNKASSGVINVITKESGANSVAVNMDSNATFNHSGFFSYSPAELMDFSVAYEKQVGDGYEGLTTGVATSTPTLAGLPDTGKVPRGAEMNSVLLRFRYNKTQLMLQTFESENKVLAGNITVFNHTLHTQRGNLASIKQEFNLDKVDTKTYLDYNQYYTRLNIDDQLAPGVGGIFNFKNDGAANYRWRLGNSLTYHITDNLDFFLLGEIEKRSTGEYSLLNATTESTLVTVMPTDNLYERSYATQLDLTYQDWRFLLGGRYTKNDLSGSKFTPRFSSIYKINKNQSLKFLYANGFNAPNFLQQIISLPGAIQGNPDLEAESISTTDIAYSYYDEHRLFVFNAYYLEAKDFIARVIVPGSGINFLNSGNFDRYGFEIDYQYKYDRLKFFGNLGYVHQANQNIKSDTAAKFLPKFTAVLGSGYDINPKNSVGGSLRFIGARNGLDPIYLLNLDYAYKLENLEVGISVRNLLDENTLEPDISNFNSNAYLESDPGFNLLAHIKYKL